MRVCVCIVCVLLFFFSSAPLFILLLNKDAFKKKKKEKAEVLTCTLCRGKETGVNTKHSVQSSKKKKQLGLLISVYPLKLSHRG